MSDWRPKQGPARFRGVPFFVDVGEQGGGRRAVGHDVPFSEAAPFVEDLGKRPGQFSVEGYVLGTEYEAAKNALRDALETEGPGELVHPFFGTRRVQVDTFRIRETRADGGFAHFTIEFLETSASPEQPTTVYDSKRTVAAASAGAKSTTSVQFLADFTAFATPRTSILGVLASANAAVDSVVDAQALGDQALADLKRQISNVTANASALVSSPEDLLASHAAVFEALSAALVESAVDPVASLLALFKFDPGVRPPDTTESRARERASFDALQHLTQRLAIVHASDVAITLRYDSYDAARRTRGAITDLIDALTEAVTDDTYPDFIALRQALVRGLPDDTLDLPREQTFTPATVAPSLVVAHRLYGNLDREADLCARNKLRHPAFVAADVGLEVLSGE